MDLVMFHSGILPEYLEYTFKQIRMFNPTLNVHFITDEKYLQDPVFARHNIIVVNKDNYYSNKIKAIEELYARPSFDFWTITMTRLIYIENYIMVNHLVNVYHFENDILLYYDLETLHSIFIDTYKHGAITTGGPDKSMTGFMYIKNYIVLARLTYFFEIVLEKHGVKGVKNLFKLDMVNEMTLIKAYQTKISDSIENLPSIPFGENSKNFDKFNSIFDPASWGQYVGGTTDKIPGAKPKDHYIGQLLIENPDYTVIWKLDNENRKIPYFKYGENEVKINNLHIHSKELHKYLS